MIHQPSIDDIRILFYPMNIELDRFQALFQCSLTAPDIHLFKEFRNLRFNDEKKLKMHFLFQSNANSPGIRRIKTLGLEVKFRNFFSTKNVSTKDRIFIYKKIRNERIECTNLVVVVFREKVGNHDRYKSAQRSIAK